MTLEIDRRQFLISSGTITGLGLVTSSHVVTGVARASAVGLKVDYIDCPLGLENPRPRFSWRVESQQRNVRQSAYRIRVAQSKEALREEQDYLWDSGKVSSGESIGIEYQGRELKSRQRCWWHVQIWDDRGESSQFSEPSWWEMGLLHVDDWSGRWLAVEDAVTKADRQAGLQWIWGMQSPNEHGVRRFRLKFHLPASAQGGELFAVVNDWLWTSHIRGIWIDGNACQGDPGRRASHNWHLASDPLTAQRLPLDRIASGEHVLAVEVSNDEPLPAEMSRGFALLCRFTLISGQTVRVGSGAEWQTSLASETDLAWRQVEYDARAWEKVRVAPIEDFHPMPPAPAMYLRRVFQLRMPVAKARLYATAMGAYEARMNGQRVGNALLTPERSQYAKHVLYRTYDVTALLTSGQNVLGLTVGDGWYASWEGLYGFGPPPRRVLAQLEVEFADGSREVVATGPGWRTAESAIRRSEIRVGEVYDARLEQLGWDTPQFDDTHWGAAEETEPPPSRVIAQTSPPIRVIQTLPALAISQPREGVYVFDFGQCFAGWCRLHVKGERGSRVELRFAELLTPAGEIGYDRIEMGEPKKDVYILRGDGQQETFEPHFTYRGFRFVEVSGLSQEPTTQSLEGLVIHSDLEMTGHLRMGSQLIQQIWLNALWSQRSNAVGTPTDCPNREQRGWGPDAGDFWDAAAFNMDVCAFTSHQIDNFVDDQLPNGMFRAAAPEPRRSNSTFLGGAGPVEGDGAILLIWTVWQRYGDLALIQRNWEAMSRHVQSILRDNPDYLWRKKGGLGWWIGDWLSFESEEQKKFAPKPVPHTPEELIATACWARLTDLLAQMAQAIGRTADAARLHDQLGHIRNAFSSAFVKPDGTVGSGSQTGYILALHYGLLPESIKKLSVSNLVSDIRNRGVSLTTGAYFGTHFSLDVLADEGFADLVYSLLLRTEYPSWGYMIRHGATTIWESWNGITDFENELHKNSQNQYALASICGFLFRRIAGIDLATPGFGRVIVRPVLDPRMKKGGGDYHSIRGLISTDWEQTPEGGFTLDVTIPANTAAEIHLPKRPDSHIFEGRRNIFTHRDLQVSELHDCKVIICTGSGQYRFVVT